MNIKKRNILINILVISLYFLWPYFLDSIVGLLNFPNEVNLYISLFSNFIFLSIVIYIYQDKLSKYCNNYKKKFKSNFLNGLKIFLIGICLYILFNTIINHLSIPILNSQTSLEKMLKTIPIIFVLNTLFYYPIIEELVFKLSLKEIIKNKWCFVIVTGLLNAFFQIFFSVDNITDFVYLIPFTIFFASLSYIYYKTDNIVYPILFRICYNVIPCVIYIIDLFNTL